MVKSALKADEVKCLLYISILVLWFLRSSQLCNELLTYAFLYLIPLLNYALLLTTLEIQYLLVRYLFLPLDSHIRHFKRSKRLSMFTLHTSLIKIVLLSTLSHGEYSPRSMTSLVIQKLIGYPITIIISRNITLMA